MAPGWLTSRVDLLAVFSSTGSDRPVARSQSILPDLVRFRSTSGQSASSVFAPVTSQAIQEPLLAGLRAWFVGQLRERKTPQLLLSCEDPDRDALSPRRGSVGASASHECASANERQQIIPCLNQINEPRPLYHFKPKQDTALSHTRAQTGYQNCPANVHRNLASSVA